MIEGTRLVHSDSLAAYLCYMAIRLLEIHRVLKLTGSLFLHCDQTAGAYLYELLDAIFGADNHVSEIIWKRTSSRNDAKRFGTITDYILFYAKAEQQRVWNTLYVPHDPEYIANFYRYEDERGKYRLDHIIRTASMGRRPNLTYEYQGYTPEYGWRMERSRLESLDQEGMLVWSDTGRPYRKRYLTLGRYATNLWDDINNLSGQARERTGYPTQKPVALAERIITASTNPGDVVLDCFAGCAYAGVAAERLGRQWVACDFNPRAWTVFKRQFNKPSLALLRCNDETTGQQVLGNEPIATVHGPTELPIRTSPEVDVAPQSFVPAGTSVQGSGQHHTGAGYAGNAAGTQRLHGLVLRLRQPDARRQHHQDDPQLPPGPHRAQVPGGHQQRDPEPRAHVSLSQHPQEQPADRPVAVPSGNRRRRGNDGELGERPYQPGLRIGAGDGIVRPGVCRADDAGELEAFIPPAFL